MGITIVKYSEETFVLNRMDQLSHKLYNMVLQNDVEVLSATV